MECSILIITNIRKRWKVGSNWPPNFTN